MFEYDNFQVAFRQCCANKQLLTKETQKHLNVCYAHMMLHSGSARVDVCLCGWAQMNVYVSCSGAAVELSGRQLGARYFFSQAKQPLQGGGSNEGVFFSTSG